ncbi:MAG: hypothetical protein WAS21_16275 [Geminicoccaceae bacterium]
MGLVLSTTVPVAAHGINERVSIGQGGVQGDNSSQAASAMSPDVRFVVFSSYASNLVPGNDSNHESDAFVRDRQTGTTERISQTPSGTAGNDWSGSHSISADGRFVVFYSYASNLVAGDTNHKSDVFVRDRKTGTTQRINLGRDGAQGNGRSFSGPISADGRFVAFSSGASNLVPGDTNGSFDAFVHDRKSGTIRRVSLGLGGVQGNGHSTSQAMSPDGRFIVLWSEASNLVPGDTNNEADIFVLDRKLGTTERVSVGQDGTQGNDDGDSDSGAAISADGRFVAFCSSASNLVPSDTNNESDVFVRDRQTGTTQRVSVGRSGAQGNGHIFGATMSADGRFVAFSSHASNLVPGDTNESRDAFVHDRKTGMTRRVSVGPGGVQGNGKSHYPTISADGRFVAFVSDAGNLVAGDTNDVGDVFFRTLVP